MSKAREVVADCVERLKQRRYLDLRLLRLLLDDAEWAAIFTVHSHIIFPNEHPAVRERRRLMWRQS